MARKHPKADTNVEPVVGKPVLNKENLEGLLEIQCTREEVMAFFGFKSKTYLQKWIKQNYDGQTFEQLQAQCGVRGQASLRRMAFQVAEKQPAVLIFLLKSMCHLHEEQVVTIDTDDKQVNAFMASVKTASKAIENCTNLVAGLPAREDDGEEGDSDVKLPS